MLRTVRDGEPRTASTQLLSSEKVLIVTVLLFVHRDYNIRSITDEEPRTATSTSTQLRSFEKALRVTVLL